MKPFFDAHWSAPIAANSRLSTNTQSGMSLIEVLVALVIFALCILSSGTLLLTSLRSSQHTLFASNTTLLARDFGDLMQLIPASALSAATSIAEDNWFLFDSEVEDSDKPYYKGAPAPIPNCQDSTCTPEQIAKRSIWEWSQRTLSALPNARIVTCHDSEPKGSDGYFRWDCDTTGGLIVVKIGWSSRKEAGNTGDAVLSSVDSNGKPLRPNIVLTLFGNQTDFVTTP